MRLGDRLPAQNVERAEFDALLAWQRTRLLATAVEVTAPQAKYLNEIAREYYAALTADGYDVPQNTGTQPVRLACPRMLTCRRIDRREARLAVQAPEAGGDIWLVCGIRPAVNRRAPPPWIGRCILPSDPAMSRQHRWSDRPRRAFARSKFLPASRCAVAEAAGSPCSGGAVVRSGAQPQPGGWRLRRAESDDRPQVGQSRAGFADCFGLDSRHRFTAGDRNLATQAGTGQLAVDAQSGSWSAVGQTLKLYPFPNRTTPFRFLISRGDQPTEKISAELRLLSARPAAVIPDTALEPDEAAELMNELATGRVLGRVEKLELPPSGQSAPLAFEEVAAPPPPAAKEWRCGRAGGEVAPFAGEWLAAVGHRPGQQADDVALD